MKILKTVQYKRDWINEITLLLDKCIIYRSEGFNHYIYKEINPINNIYIFRFPGSSRGGITVDDNMVITKISLNKDTSSEYIENTNNLLQQFIGCKMEIE